jgi:hypothetical protein
MLQQAVHGVTIGLCAVNRVCLCELDATVLLAFTPGPSESYSSVINLKCYEVLNVWNLSIVTFSSLCYWRRLFP